MKFNESLPIRRATGDREGEATVLNNIGLVYQSSGELRKALEKYNEALPISRATGVRISLEGPRFNNIGVAYNSLGEAQKALDNFNEALSHQTGTGGKTKRLKPSWELRKWNKSVAI